MGLLYALDSRDEEALDEAEGVPWAYERRGMDVLVDTGKGEGEEGRMKVRVLAYVDPRTGRGRADGEYIARLRRGREESAKLGLVVGDTWGEGWDEED